MNWINKFLCIFVFSLSTLLFATNEEELGGELPDELDLPSALAIALDNNISILQAKERIEEREGVVLEVKASRKPQLEMTYNYRMVDKDRLEQFGGTPFGVEQSWKVDLTVRQQIYSGGGSKAQVADRNMRLEAAKSELLAVINNQLLDVRRRFYTILLREMEVKVQEQSLNLLEEQYKTVSSRFEAGTVSKFESLRAKVAAANGKPLLIKAHKNYDLAWERLRSSLGLFSVEKETFQKQPKIVGELKYREESIELWDAIQSARSNRHELKQLQQLEKAARHDIRAKQSRYLPNLGVFAGYETKNSDFTNELDDVVKGWAVGLEGSWPIFEGFRTKARVIQARSVYNQAKLSTQEKLLMIDEEVRTAYLDWKEANELVAATALVVEEAEEALRLANSRFEAGVGTQLDLLQSEVDLTKSRTNEIEALYQFNVAIAALYNAMGLQID